MSHPRATASNPTAAAPPFDVSHASLHRRDAVLAWSLRASAALCAGVIVLIVAFIAAEAWPALRDIGVGRLFGDASWHPTSDRYNLVPMLVATLAVTAGSVLVTAPLGIGSAIFLRFYAPRGVAAVYRRVIELLAGVPSVVYGLWGMTVLVPLIAAVSPLGQGQSVLAGVAVLSLMTLPMVALTSDAALGAVPRAYLRGAAALGLSRRAIAWRVALPAASRGVFTGVLLQTARALGETMAVLMVCGNVVQLPHSIFAPVRVLTANIALEMGYADDDHRAVLFVSGMLLLIIVALLVLLAEWFDRRRVHVA